MACSDDGCEYWGQETPEPNLIVPLRPNDPVSVRQALAVIETLMGVLILTVRIKTLIENESTCNSAIWLPSTIVEQCRLPGVGRHRYARHRHMTRGGRGSFSQGRQLVVTTSTATKSLTMAPFYEARQTCYGCRQAQVNKQTEASRKLCITGTARPHFLE